MKFNNPTLGQLELFGVVEQMLDYMAQLPQKKYDIVIGADSQVHGKSVDFVCVVAMHRRGSGGRYFWARERQEKTYTLRNRIYEEALMSLKVAGEVLKMIPPALKNTLTPIYNLEIHVDIGPNGQTKAMIQEIVGMIRGSGFNVKTKPEAYGAFVVADKHT